MKKIISIMLSLILLFCLSAPIFAETEIVDTAEEVYSEAPDYRKIAADKVLKVLDACPYYLSEDVADMSKLRVVAYPCFYVDKDSPKSYRDINLHPSLEEANKEPINMYCVVFYGDKVVFEDNVTCRGENAFITKGNTSAYSKRTLSNGIAELKEKFDVEDEEIVILMNFEGGYASISSNGRKIYRVGALFFGTEGKPILERKYSYRQLRKGSILVADFLDKHLILRGSVVRSYDIDDYIKAYTTFILILLGIVILFAALIVWIIVCFVRDIRAKRNGQ